MMNATLKGNPHARFDEGDVASAKPRSLLCGMRRLAAVMVLAVVCLALNVFGQGALLIADYDRDGVIGTADFRRAETNETFTLWLNDDDDAHGTGEGANAGDTNTDLHDIPGGEGHPRDCEDDAVNGRCDLLDFFPVLVDVSDIDDWQYRRWTLSSESVKAVFVDGLGADRAGDFHTKSMDAFGTFTSLYEAPVTSLAEGVELPKAFLGYRGMGVFVIEGAAAGDGVITLRGEKYGDETAVATLNLRVVNVEDMYGWINLRNTQPSITQPSQPSQHSQRHFVLVHGYNTNHEAARGNAAEFYKKLWQSGSDAMFTAVEWNGNQSQVKFDILDVILTPNYFVNVENAFLAARPFADACAQLPGEKILVGHGLGNVVVASAIKDHGLDYLKFVMLDAEIAGRDFAAGGRYANLPQTINFYSPSDSFFAATTFDGSPQEFPALLFSEDGFWSFNETIKSNSSFIAEVNEFMTNILRVAEEDAITDGQLAYADVIESPAVGAGAVLSAENVNAEGFIGENPEWPLYVGGEYDWVCTNVWKHSTFREVAYYHTAGLYRSLATLGPPCVSGFRTLAPYLHEVWYDADFACATDGGLPSVPPWAPSFACSAVRNGNFVGRNFDWFVNDSPCFVVHMAARPDPDPRKRRLASVGVAQHWGMHEDGVTNEQYAAAYSKLPSMMWDGINECGVMIEDNVVPMRDCGTITGTNPAGDDLHIFYVPRFVLDHATNAQHAVELIRSRNLVGDVIGDEYLHYMVSDPRETYIVEIITNTVVARHLDKPIMTNFNLNWDEERRCAVSDSTPGRSVAEYPAPYDSGVTVEEIGKVYSPGSMGVERFCVLREHYDEGTTLDGMFGLLRRVRFSGSYSLESDPLRLSEISSSGGTVISNGEWTVQCTITGLYDKFKTDLDNLMNAVSDVMDWGVEVNRNKELYRKADTGVWQTVHNTTYDLDRRMFRIIVQENYDQPFDIWLDPSRQPTVTPGEPLVFETAEAATNEAKLAVLKPSAAVAEVLTTSVVRNRYVASFGIAVNPAADGRYAVEAVLTAEARSNLVESATAATRRISVADIAALPLGVATNLMMRGCFVPGFYYTLYGAAALPMRSGLGETALPGTAYGPGLGDAEGNVTFPAVKKPSDAAGFFTIGVSATKE